MYPMDLPGTDRHGLMVWCGATKIRLVHFQWAGTGRAVVNRSYHHLSKYEGSVHVYAKPIIHGFHIWSSV